MAVVRIVELTSTGHHLVYVRLIAEALRKAGHAVVLVTRSGVLDSQAYGDNLADRDLVRVVAVDDGTSPDVALQQALVDAAVGDEVLVLPNADPHLLALLGRRARSRRGPRIVALVMQAKGPLLAGGARRTIKSVVKRVVTRLLATDPGVEVLRLGPASALGVRGVAPDPVVVDERSDVSWITDQLDPSRTWFGLVGVIDAWKNPLLVAEAFSALGESSDAGLLVVGPVSPALREDLKEAEKMAGGRLVVLDRTLTNGEFNSIVAELWATVCAYSTHAPNSTVAKSAVLGTRVVAAGSAVYLSNVAEVAPDAYNARLDAESLRDAVLLAATDDRKPSATGRLATGADFGASFVAAISAFVG